MSSWRWFEIEYEDADGYNGTKRKFMRAKTEAQARKDWHGPPIVFVWDCCECVVQ